MYERQNVNFRLTTYALHKVDELATKHSLSRSDVIRAATFVALQHEKDLEARLAVIKEAK